MPWIAAIVWLLLNVAVTSTVARSDLYEPTQKRLQYGLIWLIPVLGAVISWAVLRTSVEPAMRRGDNDANPYLDGSGDVPSHHHGDAGGSH
jgi:ABC-type nickel/cobalt efflux system permease component RcnA